ncbi:hypothetical protein H3N56_11275 [Cetobacterium sp. 2A]|uniref:hypothetical protein n=1 Tax=Cetobacterium sp. 2A TaxID=2754723 RepID=UPI00163D2092|nr:hypothetical protein [Cetobacterium sp. 2A]MBC2857014.1 hypothetical protein [Cetobacterium sp. 2A]
MERCYILKKDSKLNKSYDFYYENYEIVSKILVKKVVELFKIEESSSIALNQDWDFYLNNNLVRELGLERFFLEISSADIRDENGEWLGVWSEIKKNNSYYKKYKKFLNEYQEIDIHKVKKPQLKYDIGLNYTIRIKDNIYILLEGREERKNEFLEKNFEKIKMSEYWKMIEELEEKGQNL